MTQPKPLICTFYDLASATAALHLGDKTMLSDLHDVWLKGAAMPNTIIRNSKNYDPRRKQRGNYEARIVFPTLLASWVKQVVDKRGMVDISWFDIDRAVRSGE